MMTTVDGDTAWGRLVSHLLQLQKRAALIEAEKRQPVDADSGERAVEAEDDEMLCALDDAVHLQLRDVEDALERVRAGTYGRCTSCGEEIAEARLRALPTARRCIGCEQHSA